MTVVAAGAKCAYAHPNLQVPHVTWGDPQVVWESNGQATDPVLVTDAYGRGHLFFVDVDDSRGARLLYHLDASDSGGEAVDVQFVGNDWRIAADRFGRIHLISQGSSNSLFYTSVVSGDAGNAGAWAQPRAITSSSVGADIVSDRTGQLHVCYPLDQSVAYVRSADGGKTWEDDQPVAQTTTDDRIATHVRCAVDNEGVVHVVWVEAHPPNFYPPDGVYYTHSDKSVSSWEAPEEIAGQHYSLPTLLTDDLGHVHLIWQGDVAVGGRYYRQRASAETPWSVTETILPAGNGGLSGNAPLAVDSLGRLHAAVATTFGIAWVGRDAAWTAPTRLTGSLEGLPNKSGSIERPALSVSDGNEVDVALVFDLNRVYLLQGQIDAPQAIPTFLTETQPPSPTSARKSQATAVSDISVTPSPTLALDAAADLAGSWPSLAAILGSIFAVVALAFGALVSRRSVQ